MIHGDVNQSANTVLRIGSGGGGEKEAEGSRGVAVPGPRAPADGGAEAASGGGGGGDGGTTAASSGGSAVSPRRPMPATPGGPMVVVRCAAGIHRTGVFAYGLLVRSAAARPTARARRWIRSSRSSSAHTLASGSQGHTATEAQAGLRAMRDATADGVGDWRLTLADELIAEMRAAPCFDGAAAPAAAAAAAAAAAVADAKH